MKKSRISNQGIEGKALAPPVSVGNRMAQELEDFVRWMGEKVAFEIKRMFSGGTIDSEDPKPTVAQVLLENLERTIEQQFNEKAIEIVERMIQSVNQHSMSTVNKTFAGVSDDLKLKFENYSEGVNNVIQASTLESAQLIKNIPAKFLASVQGDVMRSITGGGGLSELMPLLKKRYVGTAKQCKQMALDQTRKAYTSISVARLQDNGVDKFIWKHSGGGKHPRKEHIELNNTEQSFTNPPFIGKMYGVDVYGLPAQLPNCKCFLKPIIKYEEWLCPLYQVKQHKSQRGSGL